MRECVEDKGRERERRKIISKKLLLPGGAFDIFIKKITKMHIENIIKNFISLIF